MDTNNKITFHVKIIAIAISDNVNFKIFPEACPRFL